MNAVLLLRAARPATVSCRSFNCWSAGIAKKNRINYLRTYPTVLVKPNGSSIKISYFEPRKIICLPGNLDLMSPEERLARLERRKPKQKVKIMEEIDIDFDESKYLSLMKSKTSV